MPLPDTLPDLAAELAGLRDALARLAAVAQQPTMAQSSVEIARNSKGAFWTVKVYDADPVQASTLAQGQVALSLFVISITVTEKRAEQHDLYDQLAHRYGGADREREP